MKHWANLSPLLSDASTAEQPVRLIERLREQDVALALWSFSQQQLPAVKQIVASGIEVAPIVPNLAAFVRDVTGGGPIKAMLGRFMALPLGAKLAIPLRNLPSAPKIAKQDFGMGLSVLTELELRRCIPLGIHRAVINSAVVDLAIALNNRQVIVTLLGLVRRTFGLAAIIETANLGTTAAKLVEWGIDTRDVVYLAPINPAGYGMRPTPEVCELVCRSGRATVAAADMTADDSLSLAESLVYVQSLDAHACVLPASVFRDRNEPQGAGVHAPSR